MGPEFSNVTAGSQQPAEHPSTWRRILSRLQFFVLLAHFTTWLKYFPDSFWLDECGTVWIVQGGFADLYRRILLLLHTPLFAAIAATTAAIGGSGEISLRTPAWLAIGLALYLFWKLASELLEPATALAAVAVFAVWPSISYAAVDARPYAFVMAALCAFYLCFFRAIRLGRARHFALCAITAATVIHLHLLFAYFLAVPVLFLLLSPQALYQHRNRWMLTLLGVFILVAPLAPFYRIMFTWGARYSFAPVPPWDAIPAILSPSRPLAFFLIVTVFCAPFIHRIRLRLTPPDRTILTFSLIASLFPVLLLFAISRVTDARLYVPRYLSPATPGLAIFWAWLIGRIDPPRVRQAIAVCTLLLILFAQWKIGNWHHERDDWRGALARASELTPNSEVPLVIYSAFVESASLDSLRNPEHVSYILSPLAAYPPAATTIIPLPLQTDDASKDFWTGEFEKSVRPAPAFNVILRAEVQYRWWRDYLIQFAASHNFRLTLEESFGQDPCMLLLRFTRS